MANHAAGVIRTLAAAILGLLFVSAGPAVASGLPEPNKDEPRPSAKTESTVVLAGGCFWGVEAVFEQLKGVSNVVSGYAGGSKLTAYYEVVGTGITGHAESVQVTYDPSQITLGTLLKVFFAVAHDPTQLNRQGPDIGSEYRSSIFYKNDEQKNVATSYIQQLDAARVFPKPIVTTVVPLPGFYPAEAYHQDFLAHHPSYPYIVVNDLPKLEALKKEFPNLIKPGLPKSN
jgi:peptide-methionine (S)-S-oxide reductase